MKNVSIKIEYRWSAYNLYGSPARSPFLNGYTLASAYILDDFSRIISEHAILDIPPELMQHVHSGIFREQDLDKHQLIGSHLTSFLSTLKHEYERHMQENKYLPADQHTLLRVEITEIDAKTLLPVKNIATIPMMNEQEYQAVVAKIKETVPATYASKEQVTAYNQFKAQSQARDDIYKKATDTYFTQLRASGFTGCNVNLNNLNDFVSDYIRVEESKMSGTISSNTDYKANSNLNLGSP